MIPEAYYTLINTSKDNDPAVVVVNSSLRSFKERETFPWHLKINIDCKFIGAHGMPTADEVKTLEIVEEEISGVLQTEDNAIFLARTTWRGTRDLVYRVRDPDAANTALQKLITEDSQLQEWEYLMEKDADWKLAQPELQLLDRDPRFS